MTTCFAPSQTPLHALFRHAAGRPNAVALIAGDETWSYHRLANEVACLSAGLRRAGIGPGDRIMLSVRTSPVYAVFLFAGMMTGAIVVPLKIEFTARELNDFLAWVQPALYIHEPDLQAQVAQLDLAHTRTFDTGDQGPGSWRHLLGYALRAQAVLPQDIDSTCLLLATSGTTGRPKLVAYNQRSMAHVVGSLQSWAIGTEACVIGSTPVAHVSGTFVLLTAMVHGSREVMIPRFDIDGVLDAVEQHGGTALFVAPFICMPLVEAQRKRPRDVSSLQVCGVGGDACRPQIAETFESTFNVTLGNTYGLTECIGSTLFGEHCRTLRGAPGRTRLVDDTGAEVVPGTVGELYLSGPNLSLGYWTGPGDIISHTREGWFASGDLMVQEANGDYRFIGRCKDQIVCNTDKISPVEVENQLVLHPAVADAAVVGVADEEAGQRVVALVKLKTDVAPDELQQWLADRLAPFKRPRQIVQVEAITRNALGKIDRVAATQVAASA
ncbi:MAG: Long-chain-fatty-acid--CoA ligase [Pseudomonas sp.]|nr:MAG: Long-chain-fatty-acid--CoA ligase [Pseudomonas sp.]